MLDLTGEGAEIFILDDEPNSISAGSDSFTNYLSSVMMAGLPLVREKSGKFKVREKSGNFRISQGNLEFC